MSLRAADPRIILRMQPEEVEGMTQPQAEVARTLRENWFWTGIFTDHATFIYDYLAPDQEPAIRWAVTYRQSFEGLHAEARRLAQEARLPGPAGSYALTGPPAELPLAWADPQELARLEQESQRLNRSMLESLESLRAFKEQLLQQKLEGKVKLGLVPSAINHMIIEAEEAFRMLGGAPTSSPAPPALEALHEHLVWLPDAAGHAGMLHGGLDALEERLLKLTQDFQQTFDGLHLKALTLQQMLRFAPRTVGALRRLNRDSMAQIASFRVFLTELRGRLEACEVMGSLPPPLADHMLREELYYTEKIAEIAGTPIS